MPTLDLQEIRATSPTLAETMRACLLRAGLSKAIGSSNFVLGNPKAWLGTAYHEVLEKILDIDLDGEIVESAVDRLWAQAIAVQYQRSAGHTLDRRFGLPERWPGYYVAQASVVLRARELVAGITIPLTTVNALAGNASGCIIRERTFTAFNGRLVGRPDVIHGREVIDYKSGTVIEFDETAQAEVVKAAYVRQLRIYGFLVNETLGWWPERGVLLPLVGAATEVKLQPEDCRREATEAVFHLDSYNEHLINGASPNELASPSVAICKWCPFKLLCQPFWETASPDWSAQLDGAAVEGFLEEPPRFIHAGTAVSISLRVHAGSEVPRRENVSPLNLATHPILTRLSTGDRVRLIGLRTRPDGVLSPTQRTVLSYVRDLPEIANPAVAP